MFQIRSWSGVILHFDADAFFASVMQAVQPKLKNKPIAVGRERGLAVAVSYEAKKMGIKRGMAFSQIRKICPQTVFLDSDYELYTLFSQKMFRIANSFFPLVEQYSVDEGFIDLKGLRRPLNLTYRQMALAFKKQVEQSLGITVSVGVSLTKSLAKLASSQQKPSGLTMVDGLKIEKFLSLIPIEKVWGIGENTAAFLQKNKIKTALDFALWPEVLVSRRLTKPFLEIWHELRGQQVYQLTPNPKQTYKSMSKTLTFSPVTDNVRLLWSKLMFNVEAVFKKARRFNYRAGKVFIFLKTKDFNYQLQSFKLLEKTSFPFLIRRQLKQAFAKIYRKNVFYRATGCYLTDLEEESVGLQLDLFGSSLLAEKAEKIYRIFDQKKIDFGSSLFDSRPLAPAEEKLDKINLPFLQLNN